MKKKINEVTDYTLDPQIQDSIEKNYRKAYGEGFKEREDRRRKEERKEKILSALILFFIITATCLLLIANSKLTDKAVKSCVEAGHSENYCYEKLA